MRVIKLQLSETDVLALVYIYSAPNFVPSAKTSISVGH